MGLNKSNCFQGIPIGHVRTSCPFLLFLMDRHENLIYASGVSYIVMSSIKTHFISVIQSERFIMELLILYCPVYIYIFECSWYSLNNENLLRQQIKITSAYHTCHISIQGSDSSQLPLQLNTTLSFSQQYKPMGCLRYDSYETF